jgi:hypothetical protein
MSRNSPSQKIARTRGGGEAFTPCGILAFPPKDPMTPYPLPSLLQPTLSVFSVLWVPAGCWGTACLTCEPVSVSLVPGTSLTQQGHLTLTLT